MAADEAQAVRAGAGRKEGRVWQRQQRPVDALRVQPGVRGRWCSSNDSVALCLTCCALHLRVCMGFWGAIMKQAHATVDKCGRLPDIPPACKGLCELSGIELVGGVWAKGEPLS